jgi:hypothetical protein
LSDPNIQWDGEPPTPGSNPNVVWDDNDQHAKALAMVHGGQNSYFPDMATAAGKTLVELAKKGVNLLNINGAGDSDDPNAFGSNSNIKQSEQEDSPAFQKPGGRFGQILANTAGTSLIGGPIEGGIAKLAGPLGGSLLARLATSQPVRSAASGAANALLTSDPGERVSSLEKGGALGVALGTLQSMTGRTVDGIVKKSDPLQLLEGDVSRTNAIPGAAQRNLFVPVSQGADPNDMLSSTIGGLYRGGLPYIPGVASQLNRQSNQGMDTMMGTMLQSSAPEGTVIPGSAVNDMQLSTKQVRQSYDDIYQNLRKVNNIAIPKDFTQELTSRIQAADPQIPTSDVDAHVDLVHNDLLHQAENSKNGTINAFNLKNTRDNIPTLAERDGQEVPAEQKAGLFDTTKDYIDEIFGKKLQQSFNLNNKPAQDILTAYKQNAPNYENFQALEKAVNSPGALSNSGSFRPGQVAGKANDFTDIQGMDQSLKAVFGKPAVQPSASARVAGYPLVGSLAALGHVPAMATIVGGGNAMATKTFQKGLYGDTALQKTLQALIDKNPMTANALGYGLRSAATSDVGEDDARSP